MQEGLHELVGILQAANVGVILRVVGRHGVHQRVGGEDVQDLVQLVQNLLDGDGGAVKGVLGRGEGLFPHHASNAGVGVYRKEAQREDHQQEIDAQQFSTQLSPRQGVPLQACLLHGRLLQSVRRFSRYALGVRPTSRVNSLVKYLPSA